MPSCPPPAPSAARTLSEPGTWLVPLDGGPPRRLDGGVLFSPDGHQMIYTGDGPDGYGHYLENADGSGARRLEGDMDLTYPAGWSWKDPAWSPDGRWIAFFRTNSVPTTFRDGLWVMRPDGSQLRQVFEFPEGQGHMPWPAAWSPDSRRLAVMTGGASGGVWIVDLASGAGHQVLRDQLFTVAWSPDSDRIVADPWGPQTKNPDGSGSFQPSVAVIDATTGARRDILHDDIATWSPSGDIVMVTALVTSDTGEARPYTFTGIARTFAPDGAHLVTETGQTVFIYDRQWCGHPLVNVDGPERHWFAWAGPSAVLVSVNAH